MNMLKILNRSNISANKQYISFLSITSFIGYWVYKKTNLETKINTYLNSNCNLTQENPQVTEGENKIVKFNGNDKKLVIYSHEEFYDSVAKYLYKKYPDKINNFYYEEEKIFTFNEWRYRRKEKPKSIQIITPEECNLDILHEYEGEDYRINFDFSYLRDSEGVIMKITRTHDCSPQEFIMSKITATCENKEAIISFIDEAKSDSKKDYEDYKKCSKETMRIYYYKKDYWALLSKAPKRPIETIYLKKGQRDTVMSYINEFFSQETRNIYLSFGIPYKSVSLIYGPPGSGKTSIIRGIASALDCDLYVLPITKDMLDTDLVGAFAYISDNEDKERIIVIEDVDTLFDENRKKDDNSNGITLQGFLNCLDGFTCVEGTLLFLTANRPEVLDYAVVRSCRIDHKIQLGYADKYQTKEMFERFLPDQKDRFNDFYDTIKHKEFTTASLQEFLFYNRECGNILDIIDKFSDIIEKNDPKNFEVIKEENKSFYS